MKFGQLLELRRSLGPDEFRPYYLRCDIADGYAISHAVCRQSMCGKAAVLEPGPARNPRRVFHPPS